MANTGFKIPIMLDLCCNFITVKPKHRFIYYTKELGVREARDKEAFLLATTLPKSLTLYPTLRRPKLA